MHKDNLACACMLGSGEEMIETSTCLFYDWQWEDESLQMLLL